MILLKRGPTLLPPSLPIPAQTRQSLKYSKSLRIPGFLSEDEIRAVKHGSKIFSLEFALTNPRWDPLRHSLFQRPRFWTPAGRSHFGPPRRAHAKTGSTGGAHRRCITRPAPLPPRVNVGTRKSLSPWKIRIPGKPDRKTLDSSSSFDPISNPISNPQIQPSNASSSIAISIDSFRRLQLQFDSKRDLSSFSAFLTRLETIQDFVVLEKRFLFAVETKIFFVC